MRRAHLRALSAVELLTGAPVGGDGVAFGSAGRSSSRWASHWALVALTFIDLDTQLLPDDITFPLLWAGVLANAFGLFVDLRSSVLGAIGGYLCLERVLGLPLDRGKEGMGYGDFKLLAALCAWAGWQVIPLVVVSPRASGASSARSRSCGHGRDRHPIPFGRYLAVGGLWRCSGVARPSPRGWATSRSCDDRGPHRRHRQRQDRRLRSFGRLGATVVDADVIAARAHPGARRCDAAVARGLRRGFVTAEGALDRAAMRSLVFERPERASGWKRSCIRRSAAKPTPRSTARAGPMWCSLSAALRIGHAPRGPDLVVDCAEALQVERTMRRSALAEDEVRRIMAAQWPRWRRLQVADDVIWNGGGTARSTPNARAFTRSLGNARGIAPQSPPTQRGAR